MSGLNRTTLEMLSGHPYDVLVIGGGIYGAMTAREAALRGYRTALVERNDFGAGSSFNSLKIVHGGIRYVQHLDMARLRVSARERAFWRRAAPDLVRPLDFTIPLTGYGISGPLAFAAGAALYTALSSGLRGPDFGGAGVVGAAAARRHLGVFAPRGLTGGGIWRDGQIRDAGRLQIAVLSAAAAAGADIANYMTVNALLQTGGKMRGATVTDRIGGGTTEIAARVVLSCTGEAAAPLAAPLLAPGAMSRFPAFSRALNIVVRRNIGDRALGIVGAERSDAIVDRGGRMYFLTPWAGLTVIGTHEAPLRGEGRDTAVADFLAILNYACPDLALEPQDILHVYDGVIPADVDDDRSDTMRRHTAGTLLDHASDGAAGLISVIGVKYTTARAIAARVLDAAAMHLDYGPGSLDMKRRSLSEKLPQVACAAVDPDDPDALAIRLEYAMREEMAMTLEDVVTRRMPLVETGALSGSKGQLRRARIREIATGLGLPDNSPTF